MFFHRKLFDSVHSFYVLFEMIYGLVLYSIDIALHYSQLITLIDFWILRNQPCILGINLTWYMIFLCCWIQSGSTFWYFMFIFIKAIDL